MSKTLSSVTINKRMYERTNKQTNKPLLVKWVKKSFKYKSLLHMYVQYRRVFVCIFVIIIVIVLFGCYCSFFVCFLYCCITCILFVKSTQNNRAHSLSSLFLIEMAKTSYKNVCNAIVFESYFCTFVSAIIRWYDEWVNVFVGWMFLWGIWSWTFFHIGVLAKENICLYLTFRIVNNKVFMLLFFLVAK